MTPARHAWIAIGLLGACTAVMQTLLVREALVIIGGDETAVAICFAVWMAATAIGSWAARSARNALWPMLTLAVLTPGTLAAIRGAIRLLPVGSPPTVLVFSAACLVLLSPACAVSGWSYASLAQTLGDPRKAAIAYVVDTLGSAIAGVLLVALALDHLLPFQLAALATALGLIATAFRASHRMRNSLLFAAIGAGALLALPPWDRSWLPWPTPAQQIEKIVSTARGAVVLTRSQEQVQALLNRQPAVVAPDPMGAELFGRVVPALHPSPSAMLFVGIPPAGALRAAHTQNIGTIHAVVGDADLVAALRHIDPSSFDPPILWTASDERSFVRHASERYDLVVVHTAEPTSISAARLLSAEFFESTQRILRPGGVLVVSMPPHAAYASEQQRLLHATVASTVRSVFSTVEALPGPVTLYVATNAPFPTDQLASLVDARLGQRAGDRQLATRSWLADTFGQSRMADARKWASLSALPSTDLHPRVYGIALDVARLRTEESTGWIVGAITLALLALGLSWFSPVSRPVAFSAATTGYASFALQLVLMALYQIVGGALYRDIALLNAAFMMAGALGAWWMLRVTPTPRALVVADSCVGLSALAVALLCSPITHASVDVGRVVIVVGCVAAGLGAGAQLSLTARDSRSTTTSTAGGMYAADLTGAAIAAVTTYTVVVPAWGLTGAAWTAVAWKLVSTASVALRRRPDDVGRASRTIPAPMIALLVTVGLGLIGVVADKLYEFTVSTGFSAAVVLILILALVATFLPVWVQESLLRAHRGSTRIAAWIGISPLHLVQFLVLLPVAALPLARCYFKVPYVFCHACPRPCCFGVMRPYVVPAALIANVQDRRFCEKVCPLGHAQRSCAKASAAAPRKLGKWAWVVRLIVLVAVAISYPVVSHDRTSDPPGWLFGTMFTNQYAPIAALFGVAAALMALSFFVQRPFCEVLCPIGAASDLVWRGERKWLTSPTERA